MCIIILNTQKALKLQNFSTLSLLKISKGVEGDKDGGGLSLASPQLLSSYAFAKVLHHTTCPDLVLCLALLRLCLRSEALNTEWRLAVSSTLILIYQTEICWQESDETLVAFWKPVILETDRTCLHCRRKWPQSLHIT
jgi:hypothetical protein